MNKDVLRPVSRGLDPACRTRHRPPGTWSDSCGKYQLLYARDRSRGQPLLLFLGVPAAGGTRTA